jgi:hypothetical protein
MGHIALIVHPRVLQRATPALVWARKLDSMDVEKRPAVSPDAKQTVPTINQI